MLTNVFSNSSSSHDNGKKFDTNMFVQEHYLRTNFMESSIGEGIDKKTQFKINNLPSPKEKSAAVCNFFVDSDLNDPSLIRNTSHVDFNDKNL